MTQLDHTTVAEQARLLVATLVQCGPLTRAEARALGMPDAWMPQAERWAERLGWIRVEGRELHATPTGEAALHSDPLVELAWGDVNERLVREAHEAADELSKQMMG